MVRRVGSVCVWCGSSTGRDGAHAAAARQVGGLLAERGARLVYGGGRVGLMGVVADAALAAGGAVTGVIPVGLFTREVAHRGLTDLVEVASMHERKQRMADEADAFVALPGGLGTLEELAEMATWAQLGVHDKPIGVLDVGGYWDPLFAMLDRAVDEGFLRPEHAALLVRATDPVELLDRLAAHEPPTVDKWLDLDAT